MLFDNNILVTINGKKIKISTYQKVTIYHLIIFLGYEPNYIALEYNNSIILKSSNFQNNKKRQIENKFR